VATGIVQITTTKTGAFTGTLTLAGTKFPLRGTLDPFGVAHFGTRKPLPAFQVIKRPGRPVPPKLNFSFQLASDNQITGELDTTDDIQFAVFAADRSNYTAARNPIAPLVPVPAGLLGTYTMTFMPEPPPNRGLDDTQYPTTTSAAKVTVAKTGAARIVGRLPDGTTTSASAPISYLNQWPVYVSLYVKAGSLSGYSQFDTTNPNQATLDATGLVWFRPAKPRAAAYPLGWPGGVLIDLLEAQ
jgi:hypothetical protein